MSTPAPPWAYCGHGADPATDPVGCPGIHVPGHTACLAHLTEAGRAGYLAGLSPRDDIDHRGTPFAEPLLQALLHALCDPATGQPNLGIAQFDRATFTGPAVFDGVTFTGEALFGGYILGDTWLGGDISTGETWIAGATFTDVAQFDGATFSDAARFSGATFSRGARFVGTTFTGPAVFGDVAFTGGAGFGGATFSGDVWFNGAIFTGDTWFDRATFTGGTGFGGATFADNVRFRWATFTALSSFGPLVCGESVDMSGAVFEAPVTIEVSARQVRCVRTRWESTATLRLRYAAVDLSDAVLSSPVAVTAHPAPFTDPYTTLDESPLSGAGYGVRVTSIRGVDAAHLVLTDTDLNACLFSGAFHLDQLRLEGRCTFAPTPTGLHRRRRIWPYRWTHRRTLAEEHHWRALTVGNPAPPRGWHPGPHHPDPDLTPGPEGVAATYRQLRKAFEDGKNEPGASDFYYGEMEMRRNDRAGTPAGERGLLWGYWLVSGYGLRSSRALAWLTAAMTSTVLVLMLWGLPTNDPKPETAGTLTAGRRLTLTTTTPDPALTGPWHRRLTADRAEKATRVVVNSVVFRSSDQNLTSVGTYIEMVSRFLEPTLLALAALAVRGRIKR